jgi:hypothetical protein
MSFRAVELVQYTDGLTLAQHSVLVIMAAYADGKEWRCRRSLTQLAASSNLHRATAARAVRRLLAPYTALDPRPLVSVVNEGSETASVNTYMLNRDLLGALKKQGRKKRDKRSYADIVIDTQGAVNSGFSHQAEVPVGVVTTPGREVPKSDIEAPKPAKVPTARSEAKKFVQKYKETMAQLTDEALSRLADQIAVRHPRSRLRNMAIDGVGELERASILRAMGEEAILRHMNMAAAGRAMLSRLDEWDSIPRSDWQLAVEIPQFYELKHHHLEPRELIRTLQGTKEQNAGIGDNAVETEPPLS